MLETGHLILYMGQYKWLNLRKRGIDEIMRIRMQTDCTIAPTNL